MSNSETLAGDTDPSESPAYTWTESDELHVLRAVLEIALEPAAEFDLRISPFARIGRNLSRPFSRTEILAKVKELRRRYEEGGGWAHGEGLEISRRVWGPAAAKKNLAGKKPKWKRRRKKKKKISIGKLLNVTDKQLENDSHPQKHFLAIISSSRGEKYHSECCQRSLSSQNDFVSSSSPSDFFTNKSGKQNDFVSSSSPSDFFTNKSGKLTDNVDLKTLKQSSDLVLTALNDVSQKHYEQHEEELIDKSVQYHVLIDTPSQHQGLMCIDQPFIHGITDFLSHGPETPPCAHEANRRKLLVESSCGVAEKRLRMALEACTNGKARARASSAFSLRSDDRDSGPLGMSKSVSDPVRHEYPMIQRTAEPYQRLGLDTESFQPSYRRITGFDDLPSFIFDHDSEYLFSAATNVIPLDMHSEELNNFKLVSKLDDV